jgi:hypothetical protein
VRVSDDVDNIFPFECFTQKPTPVEILDDFINFWRARVCWPLRCFCRLPYFVSLRDVWIQAGALPTKPPISLINLATHVPTNLAIHLPINLATHLPTNLATHLPT